MQMRCRWPANLSVNRLDFKSSIFVNLGKLNFVHLDLHKTLTSTPSPPHHPLLLAKTIIENEMNCLSLLTRNTDYGEASVDLAKFSLHLAKISSVF